MGGLEKELYHLHDHIVILGYNRHVPRLVRELAGKRQKGEEIPVLIVAEAQEPEELAHLPYVHFLPRDPAQDSVLELLNLPKARVVLVVSDEQQRENSAAVGSADARTVLYVLTLERFLIQHLSDKRRPRVIVECMEENTREHLKNSGCDEIVMIGTTSASLLASSVINPGITKFFNEVFSTLYGHEFYLCSPPPELIGKSFLQALKYLKVNYGDLLVGVKRGYQIRVNPRRFVLESGDQIVVLSTQRPNYTS